MGMSNRSILSGVIVLFMAVCVGCAPEAGPQEPRPKPPAPALKAPPQPPTYLVRRVIDGDTIEIVDAGGIRTRVRFRRIDAPELDQPGGPEAKAALERRMLGKRVRVTPHARDRYGRLIADVAVAPSR